MATVKVKFRTSSVDRKEGTLYYQVIHNRVVRQISIGYKIYPMEWDVVEGRILFQAACDKGRFCYLQSLDARLKSDVARLNDILSRLGHAGGVFTSDDVVALFLTSFGKDGNNVVISIKSLKKPDKELSDDFFRFDTAAHPDVEVVDLR